MIIPAAPGWRVKIYEPLEGRPGVRRLKESYPIIAWQEDEKGRGLLPVILRERPGSPRIPKPMSLNECSKSTVEIQEPEQ